MLQEEIELSHQRYSDVNEEVKLQFRIKSLIKI